MIARSPTDYMNARAWRRAVAPDRRRYAGSHLAGELPAGRCDARRRHGGALDLRAAAPVCGTRGCDTGWAPSVMRRADHLTTRS